MNEPCECSAETVTQTSEVKNHPAEIDKETANKQKKKKKEETKNYCQYKVFHAVVFCFVLFFRSNYLFHMKRIIIENHPRSKLHTNGEKQKKKEGKTPVLRKETRKNNDNRT